MNFRRLVSALAALAVAGTMCAGLAVTASAETTTLLSEDFGDADATTYGTTVDLPTYFSGGEVYNDTYAGKVFRVTGTSAGVTATATFNSDASDKITGDYISIDNGEAVTVEFDAYNGWLSSGSTNTITLYNSDDEPIVGYTYTSGSCYLTDVAINGTTNSTFASEWSNETKYNIQSKSTYGSSHANGFYNSSSNKNQYYVTNEDHTGYNPHISMKMSYDGAVTLTIVVGHDSLNLQYNGTFTGENKNIATMKIVSKITNEVRDSAIDNLVITKETGVSASAMYTIKYVDTNGDSIGIEDYTDYATIGTTPSISTETIYSGDNKYVYKSDDSGTVGPVAEGNATTYTVVYNTYTATSFNVTATADDGTDLTDSMLSDTTVSGYTDETYSYSPYAYILKDSVYYKYDGIDADYGSVPALTGNMDGATDIKLQYTKADSVVYYAEAESGEYYGHSANKSNYDGDNEYASGGYTRGAVYGQSGNYRYIEGITIESAGTYKVSANTVGSPDGKTRSCYLSMDSTTISDNFATLSAEAEVDCSIESAKMHLNAGTHTFYWLGNASNSCLIDYMVIELVSLDPVIEAEIVSTTTDTDITDYAPPETSTEIVKNTDDSSTGYDYDTFVNGRTVTTVYAKITNPTSSTPVIWVGGDAMVSKWSAVGDTNIYFAQFLGDISEYGEIKIVYDDVEKVVQEDTTTAEETE